MNAVQLNAMINMNEIFNKFLLAVNKFLFKLYLKQYGFIYSVCGKKEFKKLKKQEIENIITEILLDKACFQHLKAVVLIMKLNKTSN